MVVCTDSIPLAQERGSAVAMSDLEEHKKLQRRPLTRKDLI
jgi:hypothetical protein